MSRLLEEKTVIVTGGSQGIGRGIALEAASQGADVVVASPNEAPPDGGTPTHERIEAETDRQGAFVACDVTDPGDIETTLDAAASLGGVDVLVNNAGVFEQADDFFDTSREDFQAVMAVNAVAPFFFCQRAVPRMLDGGGGSIVNIASLNARLGNGKSVVYSMSKAATQMLTFALAHRLGRTDVRVNAINPGTIETPMTSVVPEDTMDRFLQHVPEGRLGQPTDIAGVTVFLASDLASYVNGESITVDGGYASTGGITVPFDSYPEVPE
jgi:NAD(P)-dependent dehydrogenase (short-subunit alcohol dehydrogenase family)